MQRLKHYGWALLLLSFNQITTAAQLELISLEERPPDLDLGAYEESIVNELPVDSQTQETAPTTPTKIAKPVNGVMFIKPDLGEFEKIHIGKKKASGDKPNWNNAEIMILQLDKKMQKITNKFKYKGEWGSLKLKMDIKKPDEVNLDYKYSF